MEYEEYLALVKSSRTYRRFDETKHVTEEQLLKLVEAAHFAPTGNNTQLLRFHVACGSEECARIFSHLHWAAALKDWDGPVEGEKPTGYILILAPEKALNNPIRCYDAGIAAQTIMLGAHTLGLGGCMLRNFDKVLTEEEGLADTGFAVTLVVALGVPGEEVVIEPATTEHGLTYWHGEGTTHHVPKLETADLIL